MSPAAQRYGDLWLAQQRSLILVVPSVLVPDELNYVINPVHPRFAAVKIGPLIDYPLDVRLLS
jgi:RES domain-containing protein